MKKKNCCKKDNGRTKGILYGLIPHIGCIGFIVGSIFGTTILVQFFKPLLMNRYFFHILILLSITLATLTAIIYLAKHKNLNKQGLKEEWKYISSLYGSTILINLVLFLLIFPALANFSFADNPNKNTQNNPIDQNNLHSILLEVDIPCSGHAPLITSELKTIKEVKNIKYEFPNKFRVEFEGDIQNDILNLEVFKEYSAKLIN